MKLTDQRNKERWWGRHVHGYGFLAIFIMLQFSFNL